MRARSAAPSAKRIADAQRDLIATVDVNPASPTAECWACGSDEPTVRAHIVAHAAGGGNEPDNFFLLCEVCHREQPDSASRAAQIAWLRGHESQIARLRRAVDPVIAAVQITLTTHRGPQEWLTRFLAESGGVDGLRAAMVEASEAPGGAHRTNVHASGIWAVVTLFDAWCRRQSRPGNDRIEP